MFLVVLFIVLSKFEEILFLVVGIFFCFFNFDEVFFVEVGDEIIFG